MISFDAIKPYVDSNDIIFDEGVDFQIIKSCFEPSAGNTIVESREDGLFSFFFFCVVNVQRLITRKLKWFNVRGA